ncbi:MAG: hypothetical protein A3J52_02800 [Omnitrophica bacterium RIFCSPHIGHO2_02_FULL_49_9]|nr:MAG: hypothetical protein A3J52_02800 [Omnitrophica bacterium RIFCSPHIGHO2_02_FULL_49_9]OGW89303.1 MAG: hypothetical protein A3A73_03575 [Omnitrophica bacterium RIFCSPLOWO2_01_FULL_50_24]
MNRTRNENGFTLMELMVVISISVLIAYALFIAVQYGDEQVRTAQLSMTLQNAARESLYQMSQELRQTAPSQVPTGANGNSIQFNIPDPSNPIDADFTVNWTGALLIQYARGGLNNRQIIRTNMTTGTTSVIANDVVSLSFTGGAAPQLITITVGAQKSLPNGRLVPTQPLQMTAQAELRNN